MVTFEVMLNKTKKDKIIKKYQTHEGDTGSPQVQIAILTEEIKELQDHLQSHKKDHSSRRGLLRKVNQRRKLLKYLMREDQQVYEDLLDLHGILIQKEKMAAIGTLMAGIAPPTPAPMLDNRPSPDGAWTS